MAWLWDAGKFTLPYSRRALSWCVTFQRPLFMGTISPFCIDDFAAAVRCRDFILNTECWASLVAQWLRICLPVQGTRVRALVWEDPTCRGATRPVSHNYWAWASGACAPNKRGRTSERPAHCDEEWPPLAATRESPCTETKTQHSQK